MSRDVYREQSRCAIKLVSDVLAKMRALNIYDNSLIIVSSDHGTDLEPRGFNGESDGLSLVYSFFDPELSRDSPGSFIILDHVIQACLMGLPFVYLGYWVQGSEKMDYKARFSPIEILRPTGWTLMSARDRHGIL